MANALIDSVLHYRRKLDKNPGDDYILNAIRKLSKVPMTVEILEATHIGKSIRKLSKRDDIVGEKAKTILKKWRETFSSQGSDKNSKLPNDSKKENLNKESNKYEKNIYSPKQTSHNHEHKKNSVSEQSFKKCINGKYINGSCNTNNSSHSLHKYDDKERNSKYMDYDPHTEISEGYNPECPELFPSNKSVKTKKPVLFETYKPSSVKRKLTDEKEQNGNKSHQKKLKSSIHSNSDNACKKSSEKKQKHSVKKEETKDSSHSFTLKKEPNKVKLHIENIEKHKLVSDAKKTKFKESSEKDRTKCKKEKLPIHSTEEFTSSEASFEDCLGLNDIVTLKKSSKSHSSKKQTSNNIPSNNIPSNNNLSKERPTEKNQNVKVSYSIPNKEKVSKHSSLKKSKLSKYSCNSSKEVPFSVPKPATKLDVADITSTLPEIQPHYIPLPRSLEFYSPKKKALTNEEAIQFTSSRHEKTAVYSGRRRDFNKKVPTLFHMCIQVLIEYKDAIEEVGDLTYEIMLPVLQSCSPKQLNNIENHNPKFIEASDELWKNHYLRDFKLLTQVPMEDETWRELYWKANREREIKLKTVTEKFHQSRSTVIPVRKVKLAYLETDKVKPPREVARIQAKHGTAGYQITKPSLPLKKKMKVSPTATNSTTSSASCSNSGKQRPKVAPLMAKTLKSLKAIKHK